MEGDKANQYLHQAHKEKTEQVRPVEGVAFKERDGRTFGDVLGKTDANQTMPAIALKMDTTMKNWIKSNLMNEDQEEPEEGEYRPEVTIGMESKDNSTNEKQKINGGDGNNDRNHFAPAPEIPANPAENQKSGVERPLDVPIHEKGENQGNINSFEIGAELNAINTPQPSNEIPGTKGDKAGCNFGPFENLLPIGCFGPFPSNGGPTLNSDRRSKKIILERYSSF
ncbi:hypothetical protein L2E82_28384 [Cichorium intybus]|uniref:Uncharacterized protein n=1 Tax=Cichorium intybus TaxID=13427 RepID=A0ACB9CVS5_CICIN|nr:hypothetical protein L2E82_28384 [Cichorium intybus]